MSVYAMRDRRELFLDGGLVERLDGLSYRVHAPERREIILSLDEPHENSNGSCYQSLVRAPDRTILYYRAGYRAPNLGEPAYRHTNERNCLCAVESTDGKHWTRVRADASPMGPNVVLDPAMTRVVSPDPVCPAVTTVFYDTNPDALPDERFKMIVTAETIDDSRGMYLFVSPDGLHFTCKRPEKFAIDSQFDSQNLAFFDHELGAYRIYHRNKHHGKRFIRTHITRDFVTFTDGHDAVFDDFLTMQLYTSQVQPYFRAPHILIGTPMRYEDFDSRWDYGLYARPGLAERVWRAGGDVGEGGGGALLRYGTASTDTIVIASRDGVHFKRYAEAFVRPGAQTRGNWAYGDNFLATGCVQTKSDLGEDFPDELSFFRVENAWLSGNNAIRRMALRLDGFVSLHADADAGVATTKPLIFEGGRLTLNVSTSVYGFVACEIQDADGVSIPGYSFEDAYPVVCDGHEVTMRWHGVLSDVRPLAGKPVKLRFRLRDADLYAMRFVPYRPDPALPQPGERIDPALYEDV